MSISQKYLRGGQIFFALVTILAACLYLSGIWMDANLITVPSIGIMVLLQAIADWNVNRLTSVFGFLASIAVFVMFGIGIFLK